jgi:hypothetical protein
MAATDRRIVPSNLGPLFGRALGRFYGPSASVTDAPTRVEARERSSIKGILFLYPPRSCQRFGV